MRLTGRKGRMVASKTLTATLVGKTSTGRYERGNIVAAALDFVEEVSEAGVDLR